MKNAIREERARSRDQRTMRDAPVLQLKWVELCGRVKKGGVAGGRIKKRYSLRRNGTGGREWGRGSGMERVTFGWNGKEGCS